MPSPDPLPDAAANLDAITVAQARRIDRYAIETLGLPGLLLMENAAINAASVVLDVLEEAVELDRDRFAVSVVCGGGNNGGDGYALARHLLGFGVDVRVCAAKPIESLRGDAKVNALACERLGLQIFACDDSAGLDACRPAWESSHALVDALLGTGVSGPPRDHAARVIQAINQAKIDRGDKLSVVSIDVPSGLDADLGTAQGPVVLADVTATFVAPKVGFAHDQARAALGRLIVAGIGLPDGAIHAALRDDAVSVSPDSA